MYFTLKMGPFAVLKLDFLEIINMSYGATVVASAANSNLIEFKK